MKYVVLLMTTDNSSSCPNMFFYIIGLEGLMNFLQAAPQVMRMTQSMKVILKITMERTSPWSTTGCSCYQMLKVSIG